MTDAKQQVIDFVRETHGSAQGTDIVERAKSGLKINEKTKCDYNRTFRRVVDFEAGGIEKLAGISRQSFYHHRAAVLHGLAMEYKQERAECDKAQRLIIMGNGDVTVAMTAARKARRAVDLYNKVMEMEAPEVRSAPRKSKRKTLPKSEDWRQVALDAAIKPAKDAVAVIAAFGVRPAEIEEGVTVAYTKTKAGKAVFIARIKGAKTTENTGLGVRWITIDPDSSGGKMLMSRFLGLTSHRLEVKRPARRIAKDFAKIREASGLKNISAYSMRHALCADMKAEGFSEENIAKVMGHISVRSQNRYGSKQQGGSNTGLLEVQTEREPREPQQSPRYTPSPS